MCVKLDPDAAKVWMSEASRCFGTCPGIVVKTFGSIYDHGNDLQACRMSVLNFLQFRFWICFRIRAARRAVGAPGGAPGGAKSPDQTWNFEFGNNVMNDVCSFRDAKHHYLKFLLIRFSCSVVVETIFWLFHNFENLKYLDFRAGRRDYLKQISLMGGAPTAQKSRFFKFSKSWKSQKLFQQTHYMRIWSRVILDNDVLHLWLNSHS